MVLDGPIQVIVNASAGTAAKVDVVHDLGEILAGDLRWHIVIARNGGDLVRLAERAAKGDWQIVVAGGGDGTVSTVANALVGTTKVLGVLPVGTLNHFAKELHLPLNLKGAVQTIRQGHVVDIDVGEVNGYRFINNSSLGLYPNIVNERAKQQRLGWGKWPAFLWAAVQVFRRYPLVDVELIVGGERLECRTPFVFVGNNKYEMEGFKIGARERLNAGELSLYITKRAGRVALIRLSLRALLRGLRKERDFAAMTTKEVSIGSRHRRLRVATDGEVEMMTAPLHYRILPDALRVIVPSKTSHKGR